MKSRLTLFVIAIVISLLVAVNVFAGGARYVGNKRSKKLHDTTHSGGSYSCQAYIKKMANKNKVYFKSEAQANKKGYHLCKPCYN